jgi:Domain of unknown function DUF11
MQAVTRRGRIVAAALVAVIALAIMVAAVPASAVPFNEASFSGYATGNVLYAHALDTGDLKVVNATEGHTGAQVNSDGIKAITNEMGRQVFAAAAAKRTAGRGSGVEVGIAKGPTEDNDIVLANLSRAAAPPDAKDSADLLGPIQGAPLLYASALASSAEANWSNSDTCVIGKDLSNGMGQAADLQLIDTGTADPKTGKLGAPLLATDAGPDPKDPDRSVAWSKSRTYLTPQTGPNAIPGRWGLTSEVAMTIAPITIGDTLTIEFLGEWVLKATAGGVPGSSSIHYGPGNVSPQTKVLSVLQDGVEQGSLTLQDLLGNTGADIPIPGVADIRIGEAPRAIGGDFGSAPTANATTASGAVDVAKVTLADGQIADVRLGHMETKAVVPEGGIDCGIPVTKSASPPGVTVNQSFVVTIKIDNPFGCDLTHVKVVDSITTDGDAKFQVLDTNPNADTVPSGSNLDSGTIIWNDIGSIAKGSSKSVTATIRAQGGGGIIKDIASVSSVLRNCSGAGEGNELVGKSLPLQVPVVLKLKLPPTGVGTSATTIFAALGLLSLAGVALRQMRRHA